MKYKIGDKVRVKPLAELALCECVVTEMLKFAGMVTTITDVNVWNEGSYYIEDGEGWYWDEDCFVNLDETLPEKTVDEKLEHLRETVDKLLIEMRVLRDRVSELERGKNEI